MGNEGYTDFVHTGPRTLAGRYMRTFWQPVHVARELERGWAKPLRIMNEDFTLYRGEDGEPRLVGFRCAHRGTQLSTGWVEGNGIRCLYHGWKYDGSGQCVEQPGEQESFATKVKIPGYPTREYLGLIFAYLGEGQPPPFPRYADFEQEGVLEAGSYIRACNYFNNVENGVDVLHVAWAHRDANMQHSLNYNSVSAHESEWGVTAYVKLSNGEIRTNQLGMPNILHFQSHPPMPSCDWTDVLAWRVPIDDTQHKSFNLRLIHATGEAAQQYEEKRKNRGGKPRASLRELTESVLRGDQRIMDIKDRRDVIVNLQDEVTQVGQGVVADRKNERLGCSDIGVILLRQIWTRELQAFAHGRAVKQWSRPLELSPTSGA